jgi:hypothetical protein
MGRPDEINQLCSWSSMFRIPFLELTEIIDVEI